MAKLLGTKYKTYEGARKRAAFEIAMAKGEYERDDKARLYHYTVTVDQDRNYRVERHNPVFRNN
jgi:hypothetical protein